MVFRREFLIAEFFYFSDERPCRQFMMSLSGFKGDERTRVKHMIELTGAKVTSYFSTDNNFLICRR